MKDIYGEPITAGCRVISYAHNHHGTGTVIDFIQSIGNVIVRMDSTQEMVAISRIDIEVKIGGSQL